MSVVWASLVIAPVSSQSSVNFNVSTPTITPTTTNVDYPLQIPPARGRWVIIIERSSLNSVVIINNTDVTEW